MKKILLIIGVIGSLGFTHVPEKLSQKGRLNDRPYAWRQADAYLEVRSSEATVISY